MTFEEKIQWHLSSLTFVSVGQSELCGVCDFLAEDVIHFSTNDCESCGSRLAGERHIAHGIGRDDGNIYHLEICHDCAAYHANGVLPDDISA